MNSRLSDLAHVAEIVGAIAVIISLVYVGQQVNDSVVASRSAAVNDANVALQSWYLEVGTDEQASSNFYRGLMSPEALPPEDEFQFLMTFHGVFLAFQNSYFLTEEGTLDPELLESLTAASIGLPCSHTTPPAMARRDAASINRPATADRAGRSS